MKKKEREYHSFELPRETYLTKFVETLVGLVAQGWYLTHMSMSLKGDMVRIKMEREKKE